MAAGRGERLPRVLVTGFSVFPGAPVNPTEALVAVVEAGKARLADLCELHTATFEVDYRGLPARLGEIGASVRPDVAIHFGLARECAGFRLERTAMNLVCCSRPDNTGHVPVEARIDGEAGPLISSLPLEEISDALRARGLPVALSDDAGDYLCNYLFYLSRARLCAGFAPAMAGFVHVPLVGETGCAMMPDDLAAGAWLIIEICCRTWLDRE